MLIVGIDCATLASKTGLSLASYQKGVLRIEKSMIAHQGASVAAQILPWVRQVTVVLLALDSPLGWPDAMGRILANHLAGHTIDIEANKLFRRRTYEVVR
jgi:predicted RNase H-like nuclease